MTYNKVVSLFFEGARGKNIPVEHVHYREHGDYVSFFFRVHEDSDIEIEVELTNDILAFDDFIISGLVNGYRTSLESVLRKELNRYDNYCVGCDIFDTCTSTGKDKELLIRKLLVQTIEAKLDN